MPEEIDQLLSQLQEGETHSSGAFQLDPVRLAAEISVVLKQQPATWLMKAIQFCLSTDPALLDIKIRSGCLALGFVPKIWNPQLLEIRDGFSFLSPELSRLRSARHFRHLLWLLAARPDLEWTLEPNLDVLGLVTLSFRKTKKASQLAPKPAFFKFEIDSPATSWFWPEWSSARDALCCAHSQIMVNDREFQLGRLITVAQGWPMRPPRNHTLWDEISSGVGEVGPFEPARTGFPPDSPAHQRAQNNGAALRLRLITSMDSQPGRWFYLIQDGYLIDRVEAAPIEGLQALIDATDLKVDASFLRVVRDQEWRNKVESTYQRCLWAVKHWREYLIPKFPPPSLLNPNTQLHRLVEKRLNGPIHEIDWDQL